MKSNLERALTEVFGHEGGFTANPKDPGNFTPSGVLKGTKYGISARAYPDLDIRNLTLSQAAAIYRKDYWSQIGADAMESGVDLCVFDTAVNSGVGRARSLYAKTRKTNSLDTIEAFSDARLSFLQSLKIWKTFGKGWAKRVARVEAVSLTWAMESLGYSKARIIEYLQHKGFKAQDKAQQNSTASKGATGGAVATGAGGGASVDQLPPGGAIVIIAVVALALVIAFILHRKAKAKKAKAKEFEKQAVVVGLSSQESIHAARYPG